MRSKPIGHFFIILGLVALLTGCNGMGGAMLGSLAQNQQNQLAQSAAGANQGGMAAENPLQGLELDLTYMDIMAAMLRTNHLMLNQKISPEANWPANMTLGDPSDQYDELLENELKRHFSCFLYYGDMSIADLMSFKKAAERPIIEAVQSVSKHVVHQRMALANAHVGSDDLQEVCFEFVQPLEEVIYTNLVAKDSGSWISCQVEVDCLRSVEAHWKSYAKFEEAFEALLDESIVDEYKATQSEIARQNELLAKQKQEKSQLELELEKVKSGVVKTESVFRQNREVEIKNEIKATEVKIEKQEIELERTQQAYEKLMEKAQQRIVVTPDRIELAKNMYSIAQAVEDNLSLALIATPLVSAKAVVDVLYLAKNSGQLAALPTVYAQEFRLKNGAANADEAMAMGMKRLELITSRAITFLPDLIDINYQIYTQNDLYGPKLAYLGRLLEEGGVKKEEGAGMLGLF